LSGYRKNTGKKTGWTAVELKIHEFPDIQWIIPNLAAIGLSALCGAPKVKKSCLALSMALAVASGGAVLGKIPVKKQDVLYLALEDSPRRLQDRMNKLNMGYPDNLHFCTEWKTGVTGLKSYLERHKEIRFCIIDTWGIFSPHRDQNVYSESTMRAHELKAVADELGIAVTIVHHARKNGNYGDTGDWMDSILGSTGLAGAVDSIILLRRKRGEEKAELLTTGRDILEHDFILSFDLDCGGWTIEGNRTDIQESELRQSIVNWLNENGPHTPAQITRGINAESEKSRTPSTIKTALARMVEAGTL
jgi:RecA-family ATPase